MRYSATLLLGLLLAAGALPGQVSPPVGQRGKAGRGLTPAASFALSEIETINLVNGNLLLRMPVVSLPPGRGGSSFTLHLLYNSQIYDVQKAIETPHPDMDATAQYLVYRSLIASSEGGWRWGYQYGLEYEFKLEGEPPYLHQSHPRKVPAQDARELPRRQLPPAAAGQQRGHGGRRRRGWLLRVRTGWQQG